MFEVTAEWLEREHGYSNVREIDGKFHGLRGMLFTTGVFVNLDEYGTSGRFCFDGWQNASLFLRDWDGVTQPEVGLDGCMAVKYHPKEKIDE